MSTPAVVRIDDDDFGYAEIDYPHNWTLSVGPRVPLSQVYNEFFGGLDWYGIFADDVVPETFGWDRLLIEAAGSDGVAYGTDDPAHFVIGGELAKSVGWLGLKGLQRSYIDTVWSDIATKRGVLRSLPDVRVPHYHFSNRGALMDQTYKKPAKDTDKALYQAWRKLDGH